MQTARKINFEVNLGTTYHENVEHVAYKMIDLDGIPCYDKDPVRYSYDACVFEELKQKLMEMFGCITLYCGPGKENVCIDYDKVNQTSWVQNKFMGTGVLPDTSCLETCSYVSIRLTHVKQTTSGDDSLAAAKFSFDEKIQRIESYFLYSTLSLIAEIGGYVGLFLGASVVQVTEVINHFFGIN